MIIVLKTINLLTKLCKKQWGMLYLTAWARGVSICLTCRLYCHSFSPKPIPIHEAWVEKKVSNNDTNRDNPY